MIQFRKLVLNNFMSYYGRTIIQLANQGIVRVEGRNEDEQASDSNMAGKSTIVEALLWCLFGKTLRGIKHNKVINRKARRDCFVSTSFKVQGVLYHCCRYRSHRKHGNKLVLHRGSVPISSRHDDDNQTRLESILDCDYDSFVNSVVFGGFDSGTRKQFALQTDAQQKQLLDSFLKFEKFEIALRRTKHEISRVEESLAGLGHDIVRYVERVSTSKRSLSEIRKSSRRVEKERLVESQKVKKEIERIASHCRPGIQQNLETVRDKVERAITKKAAVVEKLRGLQRQLKILAEKWLHKEKLIGKPCPTCGQKVKDTISISDHLRIDKAHLQVEKEAAVKALRKIERRLLYGRKRLMRLQKLKLTEDTTQAKRIQLEERLAELKRRSSSVFQEELEQAQKQYSDQVSRLLRCRYEEDRLKKRLADLEFWEQGFGNKGIKALIVRQALPAMNQKLKEYAQEIFDENVQLEFRPSKQTKKGDERELFNIHYSTRRNADTYIAESSGGRRRIDICLLLVFSWFARTCDILFVDELLDGLDSSGRERVLAILSKQRGTVVVISHSMGLKSRIGTIWTVRKRNGISTLEMQK